MSTTYNCGADFMRTDDNFIFSNALDAAILKLLCASNPVLKLIASGKQVLRIKVKIL